MNKLFDYLVILALVITVVIWIIPALDKYWLSDEALDLLSANGWGAFIPFIEFLYWPQLAFWIVVSLGLIKRIKVARTIYFSGLVLFSAISFGNGFTVLLPIEAGLYNLTGILDGAILTIAYFTSVSDEFNSSPNKSLKTDA